MTYYSYVTEPLRDLQSTLLPDDMTNNLASNWIQVISDATKHQGDGLDDWLIREVASRLAAAALPVFVVLGTVQLAGVLVCQVTLMALGQDHTPIDQCFYDLLRMIGTLFTSMFTYPFSIIDPTVYQRTPAPVIPHPKVVEDPKKPSLTPFSPLQQSKKSIYASLEKRLKGIKHIQHRLHDTFTPIPTCGAESLLNNKSAWKSSKQLDTAKQVQAFLLPQGTIEVQLDYSTQGNLKDDTAQLQGVNRLVIKKGKIHDIIALDQNSPLSQVHTLVLEEVDFTQDDLTKIAAKFPNIACFDLSRCVFAGKLDTLAQSHILCFPSFVHPPTGTSSKQVQFHFSNADEHYEDLNTRLSKDPYKAIERYYKHASSKPFHPAAPFITELGLFRYTGIKMGDIRGAQSKDKCTNKFFQGRGIVTIFSKIFPNMTSLDFEGCPALTLDPKALQYFHSQEGLPPSITRMSFKGCTHLFKDYPTPAIEAFLRALVSMEHVIEVNIENTSHLDLQKVEMEEVVKSFMVHAENILQYNPRRLCYTDKTNHPQTFKRA